MSSRPTTNMERIFSSLDLSEDEVIRTPQPLMANGRIPIFDFNQIPAPSAEESGSQSETEFFTASQGTTPCSSAEDVPLTLELLTPGTSVETLRGPRTIWNPSLETRRRRMTKRQKQSKSGVPAKRSDLPSTSRQNDSTSDGTDSHQEERERTKKRKTKKRQGGNEENGNKDEGKGKTN
ncbi:unnamed protein product [Caenorhabditis nigoni]